MNNIPSLSTYAMNKDNINGLLIRELYVSTDIAGTGSYIVVTPKLMYLHKLKDLAEKLADDPNWGVSYDFSNALPLFTFKYIGTDPRFNMSNIENNLMLLTRVK
jgi:hypothetical protein